MEERFARAAEKARSMVLDAETRLILYGLYKQATVGDCESCRRPWGPVECAKWNAWFGVKGLGKTEAMKNYVELVDSFKGGKKVSVMAIDAEEDDHKSPLMRAAQSNDADGARTGDVNERDESRRTALHWAADQNALEACRILIERGAEIDARDDEGSTSLAYAVVCQHADIAALLVEAGADPFVEDDDGESPFSLAQQTSSLKDIFVASLPKESR